MKNKNTKLIKNIKTNDNRRSVTTITTIIKTQNTTLDDEQPRKKSADKTWKRISTILNSGAAAAFLTKLLDLFGNFMSGVMQKKKSNTTEF